LLGLQGLCCCFDPSASASACGAISFAGCHKRILHSSGPLCCVRCPIYLSTSKCLTGDFLLPLLSHHVCMHRLRWATCQSRARAS
jgi:hypothetical protein